MSMVEVSGSVTLPAPADEGWRVQQASVRRRLRHERRQHGALPTFHWPRPPAVLPIGEQSLELWHDFLGEQARVVLGQLARQVAELHQQHELSNVEGGGELMQLFGDVVG